MKTNLLPLLTGLFFLFLLGCQNPSGAPGGENKNAIFAEASSGLDDYWYQGEAEISSYELLQNRYRDVHPGEVVLIFVTEDFLTERQVKNERYDNPNSTPVLKSNMIRRFTTGIYDYSIMTSVFTPTKVTEYPFTSKISHSSQDWCGQTFMQVNQEEDQYRMQLYSYFETEGDTMTRTPLAPLEDELFNRLRINPESLPTGSFELLPSLTYCRLNHQPFVIHEAEGVMAPYTGTEFEGENLRSYGVEYADIDRRLEIVFEGAAPYRIVGWTERYPSLLDGEERMTVARRLKTIKSPYWKQNNPEEATRREELEVKGL